MAELVGRVLSGRYRLLAPIGAGASAQVFLAEDTRLRRRVAVKLLHEGLAGDEGFLRRFQAEAQAAAALNHPNIVAVYDWGTDDADGVATPYLITELLGGGSLRSLLDSGQLLSPSQALLVGLEASRALDHAHRRGFVHRDIKPANLLFGDDARLRIADFGLARALAEAAWTEPEGALIGTARYASPEQARGETIDGRGDVYSLGLVLIEAVTGKVPFASDTTIATLMARVDAPVEVPESLGPLRKALARAGQPDPDDRPDAGELGVSLMAVAEDLERPEPLPLAGLAAAALAADPVDPTMLPGTRLAGPAEDVTTAVPTTAATTTVGAAAGAALYDAASEDELVVAGGEPKRRRRWPRVLLVLVLLSLIGGGAYVASLTLLVPSHEVPPLVGLDQAAAAALVEDNGWELATEEGRDDASVAGQVLAQRPAEGESLREGETVLLTISAGRELRSVPTDLVGLPEADAVGRLEAAGLTAGEPQRTPDEVVPEGHVISLAEGTPEQAETGTAVSLVVSTGPSPRVVPDVAAGADPTEACAAIEAVQLTCATREEFSDDVEEGRVMGLDPAPGTEVARDTPVEIVVSKGPDLVAVPEVIGSNVAEAVAALQAAGFVVEVFPDEAEGRVLEVDPQEGTELRRGETVSIFARRR
jgi:beta-lactam-binding protein with PASTA domain